MGFVNKAQLRGRWSGPTLGFPPSGQDPQRPPGQLWGPHRPQLPEMSVLLLAGSGQGRRDGGRGQSGTAGRPRSREQRQTDIQTREWKTGGGGQLVERRRKAAGNKGSSCNPASLPQDGAGLSGCSPPCSLGLARSLRPIEECQRAKAPEQMRV